MIIREEHTVDAGKQDEHGYYDYYYAYTDVEFVDEIDGTLLCFRFYDHEDEVYFERMRQDDQLMAVYDGKQEYKTIESYLHPVALHKRFPKNLPLFRAACKYLRDDKGLKHLKVYNNSESEPFTTFLLDKFVD